MKAAFYRNWKKLALVITSVFWASCGDDSSSTAPISTSTETSADSQCQGSDNQCKNDDNNPAFEKNSSSSFEEQSMMLLYGVAVPPNERYSSTPTQSSSSSNTASSSSETGFSSSEVVPQSSSETGVSSSEVVPQSSSGDSGEKIACVDTIVKETYSDYTYEVPSVKCDDGEEFALEAICPDYGIPAAPCRKTYIGKDGKTYNEEEFKKIYTIKDTPIASSNSNIKSSSSFTEISPIYGIPMDKDLK